MVGSENGTVKADGLPATWSQVVSIQVVSIEIVSIQTEVISIQTSSRFDTAQVVSIQPVQ